MHTSKAVRLEGISSSNLAQNNEHYEHAALSSVVGEQQHKPLDELFLQQRAISIWQIPHSSSTCAHYASSEPQSNRDTKMDAARNESARRELRAFLRRHRYEPQGRLSRAGALGEKDLDAIMRGRLLPVWQWVFRNVKSESDVEIIKRNVRVARQQVESCKQERESAKARRDALESRKKQLHESLSRAKERERNLLRSMRALESEDALAVHSTVDSKQREVLKIAYNAQQHESLAQLNDKVSDLKVKVVRCDDGAVQKKFQSSSSSAAMKNPIAVLLREYLRMLKAGDAEIVDFGDSDVAHLRDFGGSVLVQWLTELATAQGSDLLSFADQEEVEYAAHVAEHTSSSRDALAQVQHLLQTNQKEHIAKFLETQTLYAKAQQASARACALQQQASRDFDLWDEEESGNMDGPSVSSSPASESDSKRVIADTVRLEMEAKAQRAALDVAKQTHEALAQQIQASKQQKADLDQKLELMRSFEQRQREILDQLDLMFQQNQEVTVAMGPRQEQLRSFVCEHLQHEYAHKSEVMLETWRKLMSEELRSLSSTTRLDKLDTAVKSVELTMDAHQHHAAAAPPRQEVAMAVPFSEFSINQIQHARGGDDITTGNGAHRDQEANTGGLIQVLNAMRVPEYGSWGKVLTTLQQHDHQGQVAARMLHERLEMLALQPQEDQQQTQIRKCHLSTSSGPQVQALLGDVRSRTEEMQTAAFPALEEIVATNAETVKKELVRLHTAVDAWFEQRGFSVQLEEQDSQLS